MSGQIFISHAVEDKDVGEVVCEMLEGAGWKCWIAPRNILPGGDWGEAIIDAINQSRLMVLVYSESACNSVQVKREVERGVSKGVTILPFRIENTPVSKSLEYYLATAVWLDASSTPVAPHLELLKQTVSRLIGPPQPELGAAHECAACRTGMEPWEAKCRNCGQARELSPAAKAVFARRKLRRRRMFRPRSRRAKVTILVVAIAVLSLVVYAAFFWPRDNFEKHLNDGQMYGSQGELNRAIEEFGKAIAIEPANWLGYRLRGFTYLQRGNARGVGQDIMLAKADLEKATKMNPDDEVAHFYLGQTYLSLAAPDPAIEEFSKAIKINPNYRDSWKWRGLVRAQKQDFELAIADYSKAIDILPVDPESLVSRGNIFLMINKYDAAVKDYQAAAYLNSRSPAPYRGLAEVSRKQGRTSEAIQNDRIADAIASGQPTPTPLPQP